MKWVRHEKLSDVATIFKIVYVVLSSTPQRRHIIYITKYIIKILQKIEVQIIPLYRNDGHLGGNKNTYSRVCSII